MFNAQRNVPCRYKGGRSFTSDVMDGVRLHLVEVASTIQERYWISVNFTANPKDSDMKKASQKREAL